MNHGLTPDKLIAALASVPVRCTLAKNPVGNLAIIDESNTYIGFIDLLTGEVDVDGEDGRE